MTPETPTGRPSRRSLAPAALLVLAACASEAWAWRRPDGAEDPERLRGDVDACEEYARVADMDGDRFPELRNPRPWGGWGSFPFELCMHERGWDLTDVSRG